MTKTITQEDENEFSLAIGGGGPIHLDPEWARPRYGGTLVHGMLAVAPIAQMMLQVFGDRWFTAGRLEIKFTGYVLTGDQVTAVCQLREVKADPNGDLVVYDATCRKSDGVVVVAATATCLAGA